MKVHGAISSLLVIMLLLSVCLLSQIFIKDCSHGQLQCMPSNALCMKLLLNCQEEYKTIASDISPKEGQTLFCVMPAWSGVEQRTSTIIFIRQNSSEPSFIVFCSNSWYGNYMKKDNDCRYHFALYILYSFSEKYRLTCVIKGIQIKFITYLN